MLTGKLDNTTALTVFPVSKRRTLIKTVAQLEAIQREFAPTDLLPIKLSYTNGIDGEGFFFRDSAPMVFVHKSEK